VPAILGCSFTSVQYYGHVCPDCSRTAPCRVSPARQFYSSTCVTTEKFSVHFSEGFVSFLVLLLWYVCLFQAMFLHAVSEIPLTNSSNKVSLCSCRAITKVREMEVKRSSTSATSGTSGKLREGSTQVGPATPSSAAGNKVVVPPAPAPAPVAQKSKPGSSSRGRGSGAPAQSEGRANKSTVTITLRDDIPLNISQVRLCVCVCECKVCICVHVSVCVSAGCVVCV